MEITFDPRLDTEKKVWMVAVLIDGAWAAEIWNADAKAQNGMEMHVFAASGKTLFGGNKWQPKTLWDCRHWCETAAQSGELRAAARPMTQDERDDTIITR